VKELAIAHVAPLTTSVPGAHLVHDEVRAVLAAQVGEHGQRRLVAVHRVDRLHDDEHVPRRV